MLSHTILGDPDTLMSSECSPSKLRWFTAPHALSFLPLTLNQNHNQGYQACIIFIENCIEFGYIASNASVTTLFTPLKHTNLTDLKIQNLRARINPLHQSEFQPDYHIVDLTLLMMLVSLFLLPNFWVWLHSVV